MVPLRLGHLHRNFSLWAGTVTHDDKNNTGLKSPRWSGPTKRLPETLDGKCVLDVLWPLTSNQCPCAEDKPDCLHDGQKDLASPASCPEGQLSCAWRLLKRQNQPPRDTQRTKGTFLETGRVAPEQLSVFTRQCHCSLPSWDPGPQLFPRGSTQSLGKKKRPNEIIHKI